MLQFSIKRFLVIIVYCFILEFGFVTHLIHNFYRITLRSLTHFFTLRTSIC